MKRKELAGLVVGKLTVIDLDYRDPRGRLFWKCQCECGAEKSIIAHSLSQGKSLSCGCTVFEKPSDVVGKRFGKWFIESALPREKGKARRYVCKCDCGSVRHLLSKELKNGKSKSCGCAVKLPKGGSAKNSVWYTYQTCARKRDIKWEISKEQFYPLVEGNCFYCGCVPSQVRTTVTGSSCKYNGIDRVDSLKDYSINNVVTCCKHCNFAKNTMNHWDFMDWIGRIYIHSIAKKAPYGPERSWLELDDGTWEEINCEAYN